MEEEDTRIIDAEYTVISVEPITKFSEINEETVKNLRPILQRFMDSYAEKPENMTDEAWLTKKLGEELPEKFSEEIKAMSCEIVASVREFDQNLASLDNAANAGTPKEVWLADKLQNAAVGVNVVDYGNYLQGIDDTLRANNEAMMNVIQRADGNINMNPNLDGFIAEQEVELLADRFSLTETEQGDILRQLFKGGDSSRYGLLNAVTAASQNAEDYERATELERIGGEILALPTQKAMLPFSENNMINVTPQRKEVVLA